jgi:hypothetical protein
LLTDVSENGAQAINARIEIARLSEEKTMSNISFLDVYPKKSSGTQRFRYLPCTRKDREKDKNPESFSEPILNSKFFILKPVFGTYLLSN